MLIYIIGSCLGRGVSSDGIGWIRYKYAIMHFSYTYTYNFMRVLESKGMLTQTLAFIIPILKQLRRKWKDQKKETRPDDFGKRQD